MVRLCGACLALLAFAIALIQGMAAGNPTEIVLSRAIQALVFFCILGLTVGWVAYRVLDEHALQKHRDMFSEVEEDEAAAARTAAEASDASTSNGMDAGNAQTSDQAAVGG